MAEKEYKYANWNNGASASFVRDRIEECFQELSNKIGSGSGGGGTNNSYFVKYTDLTRTTWEETEQGSYICNLQNIIGTTHTALLTVPFFPIKDNCIYSDIKLDNFKIRVLYT